MLVESGSSHTDCGHHNVCTHHYCPAVPPYRCVCPILTLMSVESGSSHKDCGHHNVCTHHYSPAVPPYRCFYPILTLMLVESGSSRKDCLYSSSLPCCATIQMCLPWVHDNSPKTISPIWQLVAYDFWSMRSFAEYDIWSEKKVRYDIWSKLSCHCFSTKRRTRRNVTSTKCHWLIKQKKIIRNHFVYLTYNL